MVENKLLTALEIAKIACDIETEGMAFYNAAAKAEASSENQALFEDLARQELEHLNRFRTLYKELDEKSGGTESTTEYLFDDTQTRYLKTISQGKVFPRESDVADFFEENPDAVEILSAALESEKNSILFYTEILNHTAFASSREILAAIINEEKKHILMLNRRLMQLP